MANETVLVSEVGMDDRLKELVVGACERAKVQYVLWSGRGAPAKDAPPSLLVAPLASGRREIPEDLAGLITRDFPGLPLLLLCEEALIRQSVTLQNGRVTLLGTPLSLEKISSRIRTALAAEEDDGQNGRQATSGVREYRGPHWWAASLAQQSDDGEDDDRRTPVIESNPEIGLATILPLNRGQKAARDLERIGQILRSGIPEDRVAEALSEVAIAGLWLSPGAKSWSFYCSDAAISFALMSPRRLPRYWSVSSRLAKMKPSFRTVPASSSDLVLVGSGLDSVLKLDGHGEIPPETLDKFVDGGGPALLDYLDSRQSSWGPDFSAVIVEVR